MSSTCLKRCDITPADARDALHEHEKRELHVDARVWHEVDCPGTVAVLTLETPDEFLSLIWQSGTATRPLAPEGEPRSLLDCAGRLAAVGWSFKALVERGYGWFEKCVAIDRAFDRSKFGWIVVTPPVFSEINETPHGTIYVFDGVHKSIVLAKKLLRDELRWAPIEVLLLEPRRH